MMEKVEKRYIIDYLTKMNWKVYVMRIEKPSRELWIEEIISKTFSLYWSRFFLFVLPFLVGAVVTGTLGAVLFWSMPLPPTPAAGASYEVLLRWFSSFISTLIVIFALLGIVSFIIGAFTTGIVVKCVSDILEKGNSTLIEGFNFAMSKLPSLLVAEIVTGILVFIGCLLLIVPGIILSIMFSLVVPTIIIEQKGAFESLGRSRQLVSNRWGKTFVLILILGIMVGIVSGIASVIAIPFGTAQFGLTAASWVVISLVTAFVAPISPLATTFLYYSMVAREIPPPPLPPPPP